MLARTVARATLQQIPKQVLQRQRQNFSAWHNLRQFARGFEPHPFQRLPITQRAAPADYGKLVKRSVKQAVVYFPLGFAILGWPWVAVQMLDGHI